jgi:hypothetical protein
MSKMTESELKAILSAEIADSIGHIGGELSEQRRKALDYYLGQPFGNEIEGRSKVVSTDVSDTIEWYNDSEWVIYGDGDGAHGIAYASATGFSVAGANVAAVYHAGRRVKAVGALTGTIYGTIASSAFATNTAVTVTWDAGALQNEALTVYLGILSRANSALPANAARTDIASTFTAPQTFNGAVTLGAALNEAAEIAIASAATVNIGAAASSNLLITGTTAITSLSTANAGIRRLLRFAGALTLTHNAASLILPGGANIVTAVNDTAEFLSLGAGNWVCVGYTRRDGNPITIAAFGGRVLQIVESVSSSVATGSSQIPQDDTVPQITEGDEYITAAITPHSASNKLLVEFEGLFSGSASGVFIAIALFQDSFADAVAATIVASSNINQASPVRLSHYQQASGTSLITFRVRAGGEAATVVTFNGQAGTRIFGTLSKSRLRITEIVA